MRERPLASQVPTPWLLISGGFHTEGGMDRANLALALYLLERGTPVHIVTHRADAALTGHPLATVHMVERPLASFLLGSFQLSRRARQVARELRSEHPAARILGNGGSFASDDLNWVHSVHHAWPCHDAGAPLWFRFKNRITKQISRRGERRALRTARVLIANSQSTRQHLLNTLGIDPGRIRTVYLGSDPAFSIVGPEVRRQAREELNLDPEIPVIAFAGALSHDNNKGFDTLLSAWKLLTAEGGWDAALAVAGGGSGLSRWPREVAKAGLSDRIRFLGFTSRIHILYAAADLLVSPVRYEAYGLNVQEAICRGVPAMVSRDAGVAERYPADLFDMLIPDPDDARDLASRLRLWSQNHSAWKNRFHSFAEELRANNWTEMSRRICLAAEETQSSEPALSESLPEMPQNA